jgi:hypothetical protein
LPADLLAALPADLFAAALPAFLAALFEVAIRPSLVLEV